MSPVHPRFLRPANAPYVHLEFRGSMAFTFEVSIMLAYSEKAHRKLSQSQLATNWQPETANIRNNKARSFRIRAKSLKIMVGTGGFEPPTPCTPCGLSNTYLVVFKYFFNGVLLQSTPYTVQRCSTDPRKTPTAPSARRRALYFHLYGMWEACLEPGRPPVADFLTNRSTSR